MITFLYDQSSHKLRDFNQPWLSPENLRRFADAIYAKGASIEFCWGFVDGTVRPICRPGQHQRALYNGHIGVHAIKFQSVVAPNGCNGCNQTYLDQWKEEGTIVLFLTNLAYCKYWNNIHMISMVSFFVYMVTRLTPLDQI